MNTEKYFLGRVCKITAICGGIDEIKQTPIQTVPYDKLFFTEKSYPGDPDTSDRIKALYFKTMGHLMTDSEIIIWVDGKIQITSNDFIEQCLDALGDGDIAIMKHLYRKCIYEEVDHIENCIKHGNEYLATRYAHRPIRKQVEHYREMGYPENNGLNDCCIICRRNNEMMNMLFNEWWQECRLDHFDQTAIRFIMWRYGIEIKPIIFKPGSFVDVPHKILK